MVELKSLLFDLVLEHHYGGSQNKLHTSVTPGDDVMKCREGQCPRMWHIYESIDDKAVVATQNDIEDGVSRAFHKLGFCRRGGVLHEVAHSNSTEAEAVRMALAEAILNGIKEG